MDTLTDRSLTRTELRQAIDRLQELIDEIAALGLEPDETVGVFMPRSLWQHFFPPKEPAVWESGIRFGEEDFAGLLIPAATGGFQITARPPKTRWYRTYTAEQYVRDYLTAGNQLPLPVAQQNIDTSAWWLERLLPDGHELKRADITESMEASSK